jgi:hypothetical protein
MSNRISNLASLLLATLPVIVIAGIAQIGTAARVVGL